MSEDGKAEVLRRHGCLNRNPERVRDHRFVEEEFFDPRDLLQVKYEMVRAVRAEQLPITHGAVRFGLSRPACYKAIKAFDEDGLPGASFPNARDPADRTSSPPKWSPF